MGDWTMVIHGQGAHHNLSFAEEWQEAHDANKLFHGIVADLREAGQNVLDASFTYGGRQVES